MRWSIDEFFLELQSDPQRKVLFVEGNRDLAFWRDVVPVSERVNTVVYSISSIEVKIEKGGERGRLLALALLAAASTCDSRIRFFADADYDEILDNPIPTNVITTDGKDLESYAINCECIDYLIDIGFASLSDRLKNSYYDLCKIARPLAYLRILSERNQLDLPFQRTLEDGKMAKYIDLKDFSLKVQPLIRSLLPNCGMSLSRLDEISGFYAEEMRAQSTRPSEKLIHGKDFIQILALHTRDTAEAADRYLFLTISRFKNEIRRMPKIGMAENWIR